MTYKHWMLALLVPMTANAGQVLRFNNSTLDLRQMQSRFSASEKDQGRWIVQFQQTITAKDQADLSRLGAKVYRYLPEDALVVHGSRLALTDAFGARLVGILPFRGDFKLSETLPAFSVFAKGQRDLFSLTALDADDVAELVKSIQAIDPEARLVQASGKYFDMMLSLSTLPRLAAFETLEFVEAKPEILPLHMTFGDDSVESVRTQGAGDYSDVTGYETGTKVLNFDAAWAAGFSGQGQIVAMADTGLDRGSAATVAPDFQGAITTGYFFGAGSKNWADPMGHGTHVAGSVMSHGLSSGGKFRGGAYSANILPQSMWSTIIDNLNVPSKLANMFQPAFRDGARVHTNSWGAAANFGAYDGMAVQADDFLWNNPDMLILFAAGNSGVDKDKNGVIDPNSIGTPGTAKNVLTVGASENLEAVGGIQRQIKDLRPAKDNWAAEPIWSSKLSDNPNGMACFSSRGPTRDGRLKPEVVGPGTNILSNMSQEPGADALWGKYNEFYTYSGGTSMSTPLVAGAAAVTREILIKQHGLKNPSGALLKAVLMHTSLDLYPGQYGEGTATQELTHRPNNDEGYGRVNMASVVSMSAATALVDNRTGVGAGETQEIPLQVARGQNLLVNLVYFDAPGSPSAAQALVNNLDLVLVMPSGQEVTSRDAKNNHEILELSNLTEGAYKLIVKGVNVPMGKQGKQPYALVYTLRQAAH